MSEKFFSVLQNAKVKGFEAKPAGSSGWFVLRVNILVNSKDGVVTTKGAVCPECGRHKHAFGIFEHLNELTLPSQTNAFFTTKKSWPRDFSERDIFLTGDTLQVLKEGGVKGGYCVRLLTDEEKQKMKEKAKQGVRWKPPGMTVYLSGKAK